MFPETELEYAEAFIANDGERTLINSTDNEGWFQISISSNSDTKHTEITVTTPEDGQRSTKATSAQDLVNTLRSIFINLYGDDAPLQMMLSSHEDIELDDSED